MRLPTTDLVPLLAATAAGDSSFAVMPFVLLGAVLVLAALLLFFLGRKSRKRSDKEG